MPLLPDLLKHTPRDSDLQVYSQPVAVIALNAYTNDTTETLRLASRLEELYKLPSMKQLIDVLALSMLKSDTHLFLKYSQDELQAEQDYEIKIHDNKHYLVLPSTILEYADPSSATSFIRSIVDIALLQVMPVEVKNPQLLEEGFDIFAKRTMYLCDADLLRFPLDKPDAWRLIKAQLAANDLTPAPAKLALQCFNKGDHTHHGILSSIFTARALSGENTNQIKGMLSPFTRYLEQELEPTIDAFIKACDAGALEQCGLEKYKEAQYMLPMSEITRPLTAEEEMYYAACNNDVEGMIELASKIDPMLDIGSVTPIYIAMATHGCAAIIARFVKEGKIPTSALYTPTIPTGFTILNAARGDKEAYIKLQQLLPKVGELEEIDTFQRYTPIDGLPSAVSTIASRVFVENTADGEELTTLLKTIYQNPSIKPILDVLAIHSKCHDNFMSIRKHCTDNNENGMYIHSSDAMANGDASSIFNRIIIYDTKDGCIELTVAHELAHAAADVLFKTTDTVSLPWDNSAQEIIMKNCFAELLPNLQAFAYTEHERPINYQNMEEPEEIWAQDVAHLLNLNITQDTSPESTSYDMKALSYIVHFLIKFTSKAHTCGAYPKQLFYPEIFALLFEQLHWPKSDERKLIAPFKVYIESVLNPAIEQYMLAHHNEVKALEIERNAEGHYGVPIKDLVAPLTVNDELCLAILKGEVEAAKALIDKCVDPSEPAFSCARVADVALVKGQYEIFHYIMAKHPELDLTAQNPKGMSTADFAKRLGEGAITAVKQYLPDIELEREIEPELELAIGCNDQDTAVLVAEQRLVEPLRPYDYVDLLP